MSVNWSLYDRCLTNGAASSKREVSIGESVNIFISGMTGDPAYQENAIVEGETTPILASRKSPVSCIIKAPPETDIHIGDMVECFGEQWIVVELYADQMGIINGEMWLCNETLRFQNRTAEIITRHCVIDDGTYSKKSTDPAAFVMTNTYKIYMTIDDATSKLFVDKRLALGQIYAADGSMILEVYKIIGIDLKSKNFGAGSHLMVLTVQRDVYDPDVDSIEKNVANIVKGEADSSSSQAFGSCVITGRDTIRLGTTRKYIVTFADANGLSLMGVVPVWVVTSPDGISYVASGNECAIEVPLEERYVGETITISVSDSEKLFGSYEKKVQVITVG